MGRRAWIVVALCCLSLVATLGSAGAVVQDGTGSTSQADGDARDRATAQQQDFEPLELWVTIRPDGDVVWTYRYEYPIQSEDDRGAFRDYAQTFEANETAFYREWRNLSRQRASAAAREIGREMSAVDFRRSAGVEPTPTRELGYVELTYRWTNFARVVDDEVRAGDVFQGGFYLSEGQELVLVAGENLTFAEVAPSGTTSGAALAESQSVSWTGERSFPDRHPRATLRFEAGSASAATQSESMGLVEPLLLGGGLALLVLSLLAVAFVRGDLPDVGPLAGAGETESSAAAASDGAAEAPPADPRPAIESDPASGASDDPAALPDDERVVSLLEDRDGRMKQSEIVDETAWSKSKVSMLLSEMEEDGEISKIQVGRENIIALEGSEPEAAGSPFEERE